MFMMADKMLKMKSVLGNSDLQTYLGMLKSGHIRLNVRIIVLIKTS